jgi:hypothetical protein
MRLTMILAFCAAPAVADPLALMDYDALFAANATEVEVKDDGLFTLQQGDVTLIRRSGDTVEYSGVDQSGEGAMGCFVSVLASLDGALRACDIALAPAQIATQDVYRDDALAFYGANVYPPAASETVLERYEALVVQEAEIAMPFCDDPEQFVTFADRLFAPQSGAEIERMMSTPRWPVANPCL